MLVQDLIDRFVGFEDRTQKSDVALESQVRELDQSIDRLQGTLEKDEFDIEKLKSQVKYLDSLMARDDQEIWMEELEKRDMHMLEELSSLGPLMTQFLANRYETARKFFRSKQVQDHAKLEKHRDEIEALLKVLENKVRSETKRIETLRHQRDAFQMQIQEVKTLSEQQVLKEEQGLRTQLKSAMDNIQGQVASCLKEDMIPKFNEWFKRRLGDM